jgi:LysM repeat protein
MSRPLLVCSFVIAAGVGLAALAPPARSCADGLIVARGDTLSRIAWRCRSSVAAIARASGIANPNLIRIGQRLVIPGLRTAAATRPAAPAAATGYRIRPTDTLYSLARWAGVGLPALLAANPGIDPHKIEIGDAVRLPAGAADPAVLRARERGGDAAPRRAVVRSYDPPPPPPRDDKTDDVDDPRRGPEGM